MAKEDRERRNVRIRDLWMRCYSSKEIGDSEGLAEQTVREITQEFSDLKKLAKSDLAAAEHATDFDVPIYNIWKQQEKTKGASHRGQPSQRTHRRPFRRRRSISSLALRRCRLDLDVRSTFRSHSVLQAHRPNGFSAWRPPSLRWDISLFPLGLPRVRLTAP